MVKNTDNESQPKTTQALKPKSKMVLDAFIDETSPTFNNATASYASVYTDSTIESATTSASRLLTSDKAIGYLEEIAEKNNIGVNIRVASLASIVHGSATTKTTTTRADGSQVVTDKGPTQSERIKAIDLLNRMLGTYKQQDLQAGVAKRIIADLYKRHASSSREKA